MKFSFKFTGMDLIYEGEYALFHHVTLYYRVDIITETATQQASNLPVYYNLSSSLNLNLP